MVKSHDTANGQRECLFAAKSLRKPKARYSFPSGNGRAMHPAMDTLQLYPQGAFADGDNFR